MSKSEAGKLGFQALCDKYFNGDRRAAKRWVADLGRAAYFKDFRPPTSARILFNYYDKFPHLVLVRESLVNKGELFPVYPLIGGIVWR